ncbi:unnamed protein product [Allacma fusca]|uniref:SEC14-like protein 2 n=1 Tax=Allacma fusca TaxID=39272 RepID=A0A8J2KFT8_9HEXA|nr:unnamed protein product [Allacma fusca]
MKYKMSSAGVFTGAEQTALVKFRANISDLIERLGDKESHDANLIRWLRARDLNLEKAEEMLRTSLQWRLENNIDDLAKDILFDEYLLKNMPLKPGSRDKQGTIVLVCPFGRWDIKEMINDGYKEKMHYYVFKFLELFSTQLQSLNKENIQTQVVIIFDYDQFMMKQAFSQQVIKWVMEFFRLFDAHYPERMKAAYVVNVPKIFEIFWPVINPVLSARTLSKVRVLGGKSNHWRSKLREIIDSHELPSDLGGSNTAAEFFSSRLGFSIFALPRSPSYPSYDFVPVNVAAGGKFTRSFEIFTGEKMSWNFKTEDYDIGFEVLMNGEQMFPYAKVDAHLCIQDGLVSASKDGTYTLVFDNSYSRYRSKTIYYVVYVDTFKHVQFKKAASSVVLQQVAEVVEPPMNDLTQLYMIPEFLLKSLIPSSRCINLLLEDEATMVPRLLDSLLV